MGEGPTTLESAVGALLRHRRLTLAAAESCTAGLLCGRLTSVPGSSSYFRGGVLAYADAVRCLSPRTLDAYREDLRLFAAVCARASPSWSASTCLSASSTVRKDMVVKLSVGAR